jgi:hypothetical protein
METKEIAMSKSTKILGTACVLGMALAAGPAAAASLTGFAGTVTSSYGQFDPGGHADNINDWLIGGNVAGPLSDVPGLNFQVDGSYIHNWADHFSREDWNIGGSAFWASMDGRIGANVNYLTANQAGTFTNFGAFGEWYFGNLTGMAKGGWINTSGSAIGGHGNYLGAAIAGYFIPDLAITGSFDWTDFVSGFGCQTCGRSDVGANAWQIMAEYLFSEDYGVSIYGGYQYTEFRGSAPHANSFHVGLRWYTGGGSLMDRQRNGTLNPWLPATSSAAF